MFLIFFAVDDNDSSISGKRWRGDKQNTEFKNPNSYPNKDGYNDYSYIDATDYKQSEKPRKNFGGRNDYDYDEYNDYYSNDSRSRYADSDRGSVDYRQSEKSRKNFGGRNDYDYEEYNDYYPNESRFRYSESDRGCGGKSLPRGGRRGSGRFSRRPYGNTRSSNTESYSNSRFSAQNERYAENEDDYYDRSGSNSGGGSRDQSKDDYYDKWQTDERNDDYYDNNEDYYDEYQEDNNSNYGSRGSRFQGSRNRGTDRGGRRNSYGRGGSSSSSWRGQRGKDSSRPRGRGSRRGI